MLVLSRRIDESIMIGENIEVKVIDIKGETIKLGIQAPRSVPVHRKEIYEEIKRENVKAAAVDTDPEKLSQLENISKLMTGKTQPPKEET